MVREVEVEQGWTLSDYESMGDLADAVRAVRAEASILAPALRERTVWMVNSTDKGGGVAEMLPRMVALLRELGIPTRWVVIGSARPEFFRLTKRIHNLVHGMGDPALGAKERKLYEAVSRENAAAIKKFVRPDDILVVHDPQPLGAGAVLKADVGLRMVWRCHIGFDRHLPATRAAWTFLEPYASTCDLAVFSAPEYIPDYLAGRATIIHPGLDPASHKNRDLSPHKLVGILCNAGLTEERHPVLTPKFSRVAQRLGADGTFGVPMPEDEIGLLFRPVVTQISRWDRLKGFLPLLEGFVELKRRLDDRKQKLSRRHRRRLEVLRLVLAGPDPASIQDDPEAEEYLQEVIDCYVGIDPDLRKDVAVLTLPMESRKENALMVNALQRCATVVVQNSLREGFGLTATEAMAKGVPIVGTRAYGLRQQIRSGIDGTLIQNPSDPSEIARRLDDILDDVPKRMQMAQNAQQRVRDEFLIFTQLCQWIRALSRTTTLSNSTHDSDED